MKKKIAKLLEREMIPLMVFAQASGYCRERILLTAMELKIIPSITGTKKRKVCYFSREQAEKILNYLGVK